MENGFTLSKELLIGKYYKPVDEMLLACKTFYYIKFRIFSL